MSWAVEQSAPWLAGAEPLHIENAKKLIYLQFHRSLPIQILRSQYVLQKITPTNCHSACSGIKAIDVDVWFHTTNDFPKMVIFGLVDNFVALSKDQVTAAFFSL